MPHADTIVIGAGISGLTVAYRLSEAKRDVVVLSGECVGGLIQSSEGEGPTLEYGATTLACKPGIMKLIKDLGLESELQFPKQPLKNLIQFNGINYAIPQSLFGLLKWKLIGWKSKVALFRALFSSAGLPVRTPELSLQSFAAQWLTPEIAERVVAPLFAGIFGGKISELLVSDMLPEFLDSLYGGGGLRAVIKKRASAGKRRFFSLRGGNHKIIARLVATLGAKVKEEKAISVLPLSEGYAVTTNKQHWSARSVVVATQPGAAAAFLQELSPQIATLLSKIRYASLVVHHLLFKPNAIPPNCFGVLTVPPHPQGAIGILFPGNIFGNAAEVSSATLSFGGASSWNEALFLTEESVKSAAVGLIGESPTKILGHAVWKQAIPQYDSAAQLARSEVAKVAAKHPGLHFCWALTGGIGVPDRVTDAEVLVGKLLNQAASKGLLFRREEATQREGHAV